MARKSAEERREEIIEIAFRHFAEGGYNGTSTEAIAREAGISQPYLFRLFRTKRELFLACVDRCFAQVVAVFRDAADEAEEDRLHAMGHAYSERLLPNRHALLFQMQAYAVSEPEIRERVREHYQQLVRTASELAGVEEDATWEFFATGMMLNVMTMLGIDWFPERA
jgi:AcrR family transcriptional regulator